VQGYFFIQACHVRGQPFYLGHNLGHRHMQWLCRVFCERPARPTWVSLRWEHRPITAPCVTGILLPAKQIVATCGVGWAVVQNLGQFMRAHIKTWSMVLTVIRVKQ
jgi:hypothetical protein